MNPMQNRRFHLQLVIGWLLAGSTLALLMPVSPSNSTLGWSGVYWLLCAPVLMAASFSLRGNRRRRAAGLR